jgi:cysteine desulfurase / selenocysteine lyase
MDVSPINIDKSDVNSSTAFPVERYRQDHLIMQNQLDGKPFIYLDSAATSQKPNAMLDKLMQFYTQEYGKPNEKHTASKVATADEEDTRQKVADFIKAKSKKEIVFMRGATEAINVVAAGFAKRLRPQNVAIKI